MSSPAQARIAVLDTNVVLDLFLFQDPRCEGLRQALAQRQLQWIATAHMRNEFERVLSYPHITSKLEHVQKAKADMLALFDQHAQRYSEPIAKAPFTCKDADDQVFIDLAYALAQQHRGHTIELISKDKAVLSMRKRLEKQSVHVTAPKSV